jgi:hypothetical protein
MIKKWSNDACVGCDGEYKSKNMIFFLTLESFMIEKKIKSLRNKALLKKALI